MSCNNGGKTKYKYTGNEVGDFNYTGDYNFVAGGPPGSGLSAGTTVGIFYPDTLKRRLWENPNAVLDDNLLDATYPIINLRWFIEIQLDPGILLRVSDRSFYVQDADGIDRYYDARVERAPSINVTVGEWLNPNYEVSDVNFSLNNRDGFYNQYLPYGAEYRQWSDATVVIKVGFGEKYSNYFTLFEGQVTVKQGLETDRDSIQIRAFDKLDLDEIPIPPNSFSADTYPDIDSSGGGKGIPLVYGDWSENVPAWGAVSATCTNAAEVGAVEYEFKISDISLQSIGDAYLHRGDRKADSPLGPISFLMSQCVVDPENGKFIVPVGVNVFASETVLLDNQGAGAGSGFNLITAKDATIDFVAQGIQQGDRILKQSTGEYATVDSISVTQLSLTGGVTFALDDEYLVLTKKYKFMSGDTVSVICTGKSLNLMSTSRLPDISEDITDPRGIAVDFDKTFWICDNGSLKVYNINFNGTIIKTIDYADIDPSITSLSGVATTAGNFIWVVDNVSSTVYRYNYIDNALGLAFTTGSVTGVGSNLLDVTGIVAKTDNNIWLVDNDSGEFYEIDPFSAANPFVVTSFNKNAFESGATDIQDIGYDEQNSQLICVDRATLSSYRMNETTGALVSSFSLLLIADNISYPTGCCVAKDGTLFFVDASTLSYYNYNDLSYASYNPAFIARDLLQKFGGHTYADFDTSWNQTAVQLADYRARAVIKDKTNMVTYINSLLKQFNVVFHLRFGKFGLFWITFDNFRTNGRLVKEKDIKLDAFNPKKELNQYFNSAKANFDKRDFTGVILESDTYVSPAGIAFAGKEVNKKLDLPNVYRRTELDKLMPLYVRLAVPDPEFVQVTFGFRVIRTQMQDFLTVHFDGEPNIITGVKESGRRFNNVPCMVRSMKYNLDTMSVDMKLWSLGSTAFPGYTPEGRTVGGYEDIIVLTNIGRLGRVSPIGNISASSTNTITIDDVDGADAETRSSVAAGLAWAPGYVVNVIDGVTKAVLDTLTIASVSGQTITFVEDITATITPTVLNAAGFITGGTYLQYSEYPDSIEAQRFNYAFISKPTSDYPVTRTQEIEEQRAGVHSFSDGGIPYVLYPEAFISYG